MAKNKTAYLKIIVYFILFSVVFLFIERCLYLEDLGYSLQSGMNRATINTPYTDTPEFTATYLKYMERVAEYVHYREKGLVESPNHGNHTSLDDLLKNNPDSDKESLPKKAKKSNEFVYNPSNEQETLDYYSYKLNGQNSDFYFYVTNTYSETTYQSTKLTEYIREKHKSDPNSPNDIAEYMSELDVLEENYVILNTNNSRYLSSIDRNEYSILPSNLNWISKYLTDTEYAEDYNKLRMPDSNPSSNLTAAADNNSESKMISIEPQDNETVRATIRENSSEISEAPLKNEYIVYTFVDTANLDTRYESLTDDFSNNAFTYWKGKEIAQENLILIPSLLGIGSLFLFFALKLTGRNKTFPWLMRIDRISGEVFLVLLFFIMITFDLIISQIFRYFNILNHIYHSQHFFIRSIDSAIYLMFGSLLLLFGVTSIARRLKNHTLWSNTICFRFIAGIKKGMKLMGENRSLTYITAFALIILMLVHALSFFVTTRGCIYTDYTPIVFGFLIYLASFLIGSYLLMKIAAELGEIIKGTKHIAGGDFSHKLPEEFSTPALNSLSSSINNIGNGLSAAVEEKMKSEHLKTELITNVSHDIKTPLTSIINYVDLLKKLNLDQEDARNYLDILEKKTWRLKNLIEDLVEASKASAGTVQLQLTKLNFVELVRQSAGEFEDRFLEKRLEFILTVSDDAIFITADGRSTFRIIENLFSNVYKYALEGTRIYADLYSSYIDEDQILPKKRVVLSIKNISAHKLNITTDELMERFVRGDISRNTEGSGLGLSIARSLTELQHGTFTLSLDGDLFKVTIEFNVTDEIPTIVLSQ